MKPEFMTERNGRAFCLYPGLVDEAHQQGLKQIRTTLLQIPCDENGNVAICYSEVITEKGLFTGLGDASPLNVARPMLTCLIRMAETRAKARALRDAINAAVCSVEELDAAGGGDDSEDPHTGGRPVQRAATPPTPRSGQPANGNGRPGMASSAQKTMITELAKRTGSPTPDLDSLSAEDARATINALKQREHAQQK